MRVEDVVLDDKNNSQPAPFWGWVRVVGQDKIDIVDIKTEQRHIVKNWGEQVYAFLPVRKGDKVHIEENFLWGRFYEMSLQEVNQ